jgi:chorismate mutase
MMTRGIRGATTAPQNSKESILLETRRLLAALSIANQIEPESLCSAWFTTTQDLDATFPAFAARQLGWLNVPILCGHEMSVPGSLPRCIRVLLHWNTDLPQDKISHIYLEEAKKLRPDQAAAHQPPAIHQLDEWIQKKFNPI